jgi:negative regulator of flagellin synthesis FlgM
MPNGIGNIGNNRVSSLDVKSTKTGAVITTNSDTKKNEAPDISNAAKLLTLQGAPIDSARVSAVRDAISKGTFTIKPRDIAEKMISLDLPSDL